MILHSFVISHNLTYMNCYVHVLSCCSSFVETRLHFQLFWRSTNSMEHGFNNELQEWLTFSYNQPTNQPIPWNRVLLNKLTLTQLVKTLPVLYETLMFVTVFIRGSQWSLTWARWIQPTHFHATTLASILILSSHRCLRFLLGLVLSCFQTKILYSFPIFYACCMLRPSHSRPKLQRGLNTLLDISKTIHLRKKFGINITEMHKVDTHMCTYEVSV
jgi:hypothetical protein